MCSIVNVYSMTNDIYLHQMLPLHMMYIYYLVVISNQWLSYWPLLKHLSCHLFCFSTSICNKFVILLIVLINVALYNQHVYTKNIPYQSSVGKCTHKFPLEIEANFAQLQSLYASLPSRSHHGFMNGSSDVEIHSINPKLLKITCFIFLIYIMFLLLCHGDIEQNPGPFTDKMRNWKKKYFATKKESILEHLKESYIENLVKRRIEARNLSLMEYAKNPKKKKIV